MPNNNPSGSKDPNAGSKPPDDAKTEGESYITPKKPKLNSKPGKVPFPPKQPGRMPDTPAQPPTEEAGN